MDETHQQHWKTLDRYLELRSPWFTLIGEHLEDDVQQVHDYWRVERTNSVVILTIHDGTLLFPMLNYRPGLGKPTLDFPGGRISEGQTPETAARNVLEKELGVTEDAICASPKGDAKGERSSAPLSHTLLFSTLAAGLSIVHSLTKNSMAL